MESKTLGVILTVLGGAAAVWAFMRVTSVEGQTYTWQPPFASYEVTTLIGGAIALVVLIVGLTNLTKMNFIKEGNPKERDPFLGTAEFITKHQILTAVLLGVVLAPIGMAFFPYDKPRRFLFTIGMYFVVAFVIRFLAASYINTYKQRELLESQLVAPVKNHEYGTSLNKCTICGAVLHEGDKFCPECGTKVANLSARASVFTYRCECGAFLKSDVKSCGQCGKENPNVTRE
jgi:uncharacterized paraquat-inducible protein A